MLYLRKIPVDIIPFLNKNVSLCSINFQFVPHSASFLTIGNGTKNNRNGITMKLGATNE